MICPLFLKLRFSKLIDLMFISKLSLGWKTVLSEVVMRVSVQNRFITKR